MTNIAKMLKQAKQMQSQMARMQEQLAAMEKTFSVGGGAVEATVRGDNTLTGLSINPEVVDHEDVEALEDMIMTAVNGAMEEIRKAAEAEMSRITGGMNLPGLM